MAIPASLSVFRIDSTSYLTRAYVRKQIQSQASFGLQIKTASDYEDTIAINSSNFTAENAVFVNGTIIVGVPDADHGVFGASDGTRAITSIGTFYLLKGTHVSIESVCGESYGGSIELPEDPDNSEDVVIEVSGDGVSWTRLLGRITERNSSTSEYIEYRFMFGEDDGNYYVRITQTDHSGDGYDYYGFKNLRLNINTSFFDPVNKITVF